MTLFALSAPLKINHRPFLISWANIYAVFINCRCRRCRCCRRSCRSRILDDRVEQNTLIWWTRTRPSSIRPGPRRRRWITSSSWTTPPAPSRSLNGRRIKRRNKFYVLLNLVFCFKLCKSRICPTLNKLFLEFWNTSLPFNRDYTKPLFHTLFLDWP